MSEARRLVWALSPQDLEDTPLSEALTRLISWLSERSGVSAGMRVTGTPRQVQPEIEVTLLRAAQEGLTNVRKHASATRVVLTLSYMEDGITLDVQDDGVGFDPDEIRTVPDGAGGGFGLRAMRERVEHSGGTLLVESEPGRGTALVVDLPVASCGSLQSAEVLETGAP